MRLRQIAQVSGVILAGLFLISGGAFLWVRPTHIVPPSQPTNPVTVYVLDLGLHARLILPHSQGGWLMYAYGDWDFFALNQQGVGQALTALLVPTSGALGRRYFRDLADFHKFLENYSDQTLLEFAVAAAPAQELLATLEQRFQIQSATQIYNRRTGLTLVQDAQDYAIWHNSNHELVDWLRSLGCRVEGFVVWSEFGLLPDTESAENSI